MSEIERIRIPDDDMSGWIQTLHEGGFSQDEIDGILSHLNASYAEKITQAKVNSILCETLADFRSKGRLLTKEQIYYIRKGIESRFKPID